MKAGKFVVGVFFVGFVELRLLERGGYELVRYGAGLEGEVASLHRICCLHEHSHAHAPLLECFCVACCVAQCNYAHLSRRGFVHDIFFACRGL